jgi:hypothetical protein
MPYCHSAPIGRALLVLWLRLMVLLHAEGTFHVSDAKAPFWVQIEVQEALQHYY